MLRSILSDRFRKGNVARLEIELGFGGSAEDFGAGVVELALPSGDDNCRETVADEVYAGAPCSFNACGFPSRFP